MIAEKLGYTVKLFRRESGMSNEVIYTYRTDKDTFLSFSYIGNKLWQFADKAVVKDIMEIFEALYDAKYSLRSVRLVDDFGQPFTDGLSMSADNTSAYCCRRVTGKKYFSRHSYGTAIDINPVENPYIRPDGSFAPLESEPSKQEEGTQF